jgi:hypothetical protein
MIETLNTNDTCRVSTYNAKACKPFDLSLQSPHKSANKTDWDLDLLTLIKQTQLFVCMVSNKMKQTLSCILSNLPFFTSITCNKDKQRV